MILFPASGIGKATAPAYARNGARGRVVADLNEPGARQTAEQARQVAVHPEFDVLALHTDVRVYESVEKVFEETVAHFGRVDYSVTTAGVCSNPPSLVAAMLLCGRCQTPTDFKPRQSEQIEEEGGPIAENALDRYENTQATNAKGVLHHTKAAVRVMLSQEVTVLQGPSRVRQLGRGAIVNTCSIAGLMGQPGLVEYTASKFAAVGITQVAGTLCPSSQLMPCPRPYANLPALWFSAYD